MIQSSYQQSIRYRSEEPRASPINQSNLPPGEMSDPSNIHRAASMAASVDGGSDPASAANSVSTANSTSTTSTAASSCPSSVTGSTMPYNTGGWAWSSAEERGSAALSIEKTLSSPFASDDNLVGAGAPINESKVSPSQVDSTSGGAVAAAAAAGGGGVDRSGNNQSILQMSAPLHPVAEFLFQLTKMLTDANTEFIEWRNASIFVHDPPGLERDILPKYFRHSNYSSFQRQMNYFGFRKIAGKGKMAPCSYVNELATEDISSLLFIKRKKAGISSAAAKLIAQQNQITRSLDGSLGRMGYSLGGVVGADPSSMGGASLAVSSLNDPQSVILAQLQQAHIMSLTNPGIQSTTQSKAINDLNIGASGISNVLLTTDQGNVFLSSSNNPNTRTNGVATDTQSLLMQEATASSLAGGGGGMRISPTELFSFSERHPDNLVHLDSAANLRALLNQQISMFNTPGDTLVPSLSTINHSIGGLGNSLPPNTTSANAARHGPASSASNASAAANRGIVYGWNDILAGMGIYGDAVDTTNRSLLQLEQQLLYQGTASVDATSPFNLEGIFGLGASNSNGGHNVYQS